MFVDQVIIEATAGNGGSGSVSFRREKFVPRGGPNGGNGAYGGHVVISADERLTTLLDFRFQKHYNADNGGAGTGNNRHGKTGGECTLRVPIGTQVYDNTTGELIADIVEAGQSVRVCQGGRGGHGNAYYATALIQTPKFAEKGEPGQSRVLRLELKLLADVGLLGYPSVGKSTLISAVSAAKPKIADYPFTTLVPNLGVVLVEPGRSFVMADLPGLIEGASQGVGLGHQFLRHVERCRVMLHMLDVSEFTDREPLHDFAMILEELRLFNADLADRPMIVALNKCDIANPETIERVETELKSRGYDVFRIVAPSGEGTRPLLFKLMQMLDEIPVQRPVDEEIFAIKATRTEDRAWEITTPEPGVYQVVSIGIERLVAMTDVENEEAMRRLHRKFRKFGILDKIKEAGAQDGDVVRIGEVEFDYVDDDKEDEETE
ncbi:MAG: GTPase ObgE [Armatimonadota bacterium]